MFRVLSAAMDTFCTLLTPPANSAMAKLVAVRFAVLPSRIRPPLVEVSVFVKVPPEIRRPPPRLAPLGPLATITC